MDNPLDIRTASPKRPLHVWEIVMITSHPRTRDKSASRPIRIWDAQSRTVVRYRYFHFIKRAEEAALGLAYWQKPGRALEVYDSRSGRLLAQFLKRPDGAIHTWRA